MKYKFFRHSRADNSAIIHEILLNFKLMQDIVVVLATVKYDKDQIKNEGTRVLTTHSINFSDIQGPLTRQSSMGLVEFQTHRRSCGSPCYNEK